MPEKILSIEGISHIFRLNQNRDVKVLDNVSFSAEKGDLTAIIGESGCGKSTLIRIMAGLLKPSAGQVKMNGSPVASPHPDRMVMFQKPYLLPWLTLRDNISFGLKLRGDTRDIFEETLQLLIKMGLGTALDYYPKDLSVGMAQRVAIARSLISNPEILFLDECFANIDFFSSRQLIEIVKRKWRENQMTVILVTHDIEDAIQLANRVIFLGKRPGRIEKVFEIDLPYPRDIHSGKFNAIRKDIMLKAADILNMNEEILLNG